MILRIKREWMMIKGKREDDDRGGREWDRREKLKGCEGKGKGEIIGGGGVLWRRKRGKRSKEEREGEDDQKGIWDRQEGKERKPL